MVEHKIADMWKQLHDSSGGVADKRLVRSELSFDVAVIAIYVKYNTQHNL